ncbi:MAG TPA: CBS domain-containing protein [Candidatus Thermoplasmatota archaeon]|nr:CBS domain-containing protein [Candidatus Thermoplasmatota archaeon]
MHVEHFMTKNPVACGDTTPVRDVARLMQDKGVGSVIVLRNSRVVGIVTDRQLTLRVLGDDLPGETPVAHVMTENPATLTLEDTLFSAVDTLRSAGVVKRVPVVSETDELLGVVSISDIAVLAKDLADAVFLELTHSAKNEAKILTGAKRVLKTIRRPTKADRLPPEQPVRAQSAPTPPGPPPPSGGAGEPPRRQERETLASGTATAGGGEQDVAGRSEGLEFQPARREAVRERERRRAPGPE